MMRGDMLQTYKIINGIDRVDPKLFFEISAGSPTRGQHQKLVKKHARLGIRQSVHSQRVINDWNSLPTDVITSPSLNSFKSRLDKCLAQGAFQFDLTVLNLLYFRFRIRQ